MLSQFPMPKPWKNCTKSRYLARKKGSIKAYKEYHYEIHEYCLQA